MSAVGSAPRAVVTGATGFLGLHLVEALISRGWRVAALHRANSDIGALAALGVECVAGDVLDSASLCSAITQSTTAVFHAAADLSAWQPRDAQQTRVNVAGTANVVAAVLAARSPRLVHVSTIAAYGKHQEPITEQTASNAGRSWINYERSKWLAEMEVRKGTAQGLDAIIVVPSAIVGPRDRHGWAKMFIEVAHGRVPFCPPGGGTFNDVRAVAAALAAAATHGKSGESYLLSGETFSFAMLIRTVANELGAPVPRITLPTTITRMLAAAADWQGRRRDIEPAMTREMAALMCRTTVCGSRKADNEIGYRPMPVLAALRDSLAWLRNANLLPPHPSSRKLR
jgi:dihydroflavonol-4-reductase